jgi:hypothetical protein
MSGLTLKTCPGCQKSFFPRRPNHIYDSSRCRIRVERQILRGKVERVLAPGICPGCFETFQPKRKNQAYHSEQCRKASWARSRKDAYERERKRLRALGRHKKKANAQAAEDSVLAPGTGGADISSLPSTSKHLDDAAGRILAQLASNVHAEARKLARKLRNIPSSRFCQRPGCKKHVKRDEDRFCSRAHDLADYLEGIEEQKQRRRDRYAASKAA